MCVQDSVVVYNKCCTMLCQIIKFISSCLTDNSKTLPTLVTHLTVSKYRIPYILLQFLEDIVEQALSNTELTDVTEQELMSEQETLSESTHAQKRLYEAIRAQKLKEAETLSESTHAQKRLYEAIRAQKCKFVKLMSEQETLSESTHAQKRLYEAIRAQKCKFVKLRECSLYLFLIEVFKVLSSTDRYTLIESFFTEKNTNWTAYLVLISAYVNSAESNSAQIQDFIDQNFKSALSKQDIDLTIKCLLLIRQCCLETIKPQYGSYPHWFSNLPIRSKQEFEFFFRVLSQLVPYEDAMYLKIHINKAPSMPLNCQATFSEYSQLAKTQLKDMKLKGTKDLKRNYFAKKFVESIPAVVKTDVTKEEAEALKASLAKVGGEVSVE
ncbi:uncharacterized protein LOC108252404 [Diaphorina citri]|uniref:Uncharacterized protein LOC108252404 n=1 Tax=Diaphorina citri TaxID=121845 RepID=A0A1S4EBY1_DIACI|nr:uncharacterized protein LOC108252404 [Diaphorina citri]